MACSVADSGPNLPVSLPQSLSTIQANTTVIWPSRACQECKRKKTRCDMRRPSCSLCVRVGSECVFPTKRKRPEPRCSSIGRSDTKHSDRRWSQLVSSGLLDNLIQLIDSNAAQPGVRGLTGSISSASSEKSPSPSQQDALVRLAQGHGDTESSDAMLYEALSHNSVGWDSHRMNGQQDFNMASDAWDLPDSFDLSFPEHEALPNPTPSEEPSRFDDESHSRTAPSHHVVSLSAQDEGFLSLQSPTPQLDTSPTSQTQELGATKTYSLNVPASIVKHLVDVFFDRVALSLFHRPRFYAQHLQGNDSEKHQNLPLETAFILYGIMSLSARFSNSPYFSKVSPASRGEVFARYAQDIYADTTRSVDDRTPTLAYLQGCILLTFYHQSNGPSSFGWTLIGVVTRLAYDLGLDSIDRDSDHSREVPQKQWTSVEEWILKEELRRAWWSVWELDTFASTVSHRPYSFSPSAIHVFLPSSDERWFASEPIVSAPMGSTITTTWKSLQGAANQDERAWFLIANFMMRLACEMWAQKEVTQEAKWEMDCALSCFSLSLPEHFGASRSPLIFDENTFRRSNWITATHIMLQSARTYATLTEITNVEPQASRIPTGQMTQEERLVSLQQCEQHANRIIRAINAWSPDYMAFSSPFIICALFGPACLHFLSHKVSSNRPEVGKINRELVGLVFAQFGRYWNIGVLLLELMHRMEKLDVTSDLLFIAFDKESITKRFAGILPDKDMSKHQHLLGVSSAHPTGFRSNSMTACLGA